MKNTWRKSYLGFTDGKKHMQKQRMEDTLDKLVRYEGNTMYEKEFAFLLLVKGYTPDKEENYSYYSKRLDGYTKPKTRYKLQKEDTFHEVTKTVYDFVSYLIDVGIVTDEEANKYAQIESDRLQVIEEEKKQQQLEELKEEQAKKEMEKLERDKRQSENIAKWTEIGKGLMTDDVKQYVHDTIDEYWNDISSRTNIEKDTFANNTIETFTTNIGNQAFILDNAGYVFRDDINKDNLNNKILKSFYGKVFKINEGDPSITITAKVKAFYDGREYKGSKPVELETFYVYLKSEGFVARQGEKKTIAGLVCFISKNENGMYSVTEAKTGTNITAASSSKSELLKNAKRVIETNKEKLDITIENTIKRIGLSPLYDSEVKA